MAEAIPRAAGSDTERKPDEPLLSVVLPSYRSADLLTRHVPRLQAHLEALEIPFEIWVADDGSDDDGATEEAARLLGCEYVANPVNRGKGAAIRRAMRLASGRYRIYTDVDVPYRLDALDRALHYLDFKEFDMVAGDRTLEESSYYEEVSAGRRIGSALCSFVVGRFVTGGWYDTQCGFKGFRAEVADDLFGVSRVDRFAIDVELFYVALKRNYDIKRLPVQLHAMERSSVSLLRDGLVLVRDLLRIRWNQLLGRYRRGGERPGREGGIP